MFDGQFALVLASDPLGRGWNLFGTAHWLVNFDLSIGFLGASLSARFISWVEAASIVAGHVAAVVVVHDRAVARYPGAVATRAQYPLLAAMVASTVAGMILLLGP